MQISRRRRIISGLALFLAGGIADAVFGWGISKMLGAYASGLTWTDVVELPWAGIASVILVIAGALLMFWPSKKRVRITPQQRGRNLAARGENIAARLNNHRNSSLRMMEMTDPLANVINDGVSLLISFDKEGFAIPDFNGLDEIRRISFAMMIYFTRICPLLRDGHYTEAMDGSDEIAKVAVELAQSFSI